jgi:hypothetical protein
MAVSCPTDLPDRVQPKQQIPAAHFLTGLHFWKNYAMSINYCSLPCYQRCLSPYQDVWAANSKFCHLSWQYLFPPLRELSPGFSSFYQRKGPVELYGAPELLSLLSSVHCQGSMPCHTDDLRGGKSAEDPVLWTPKMNASLLAFKQDLADSSVLAHQLSGAALSACR